MKQDCQPDRAEEIEHAKEEGIIFRLLCNPLEVLGDENGFVTGLKCIEMELGEPDASGRRRPVPKEGSEHERYYKPGGVYFEACSQGKLLLLEPTEEAFCAPFIRQSVEGTLRRKAEAKHFEYTPVATDSLRYRFVALNEMGRRLVDGQGADGIRL